jgi:hypothetical protein
MQCDKDYASQGHINIHSSDRKQGYNLQNTTSVPRVSNITCAAHSILPCQSAPPAAVLAAPASDATAQPVSPAPQGRTRRCTRRTPKNPHAPVKRCAHRTPTRASLPEAGDCPEPAAMRAHVGECYGAAGCHDEAGRLQSADLVYGESRVRSAWTGGCQRAGRTVDGAGYVT